MDKEPELPDYFHYWGKARRKQDGDGSKYHLLPYHCLDVAAVGRLLLAPDKPISQFLAKQLGVSPSWLQNWFCFCLMLHDIGKFFRAFQNLSHNLSPDLVPYDGRCTYEHRHDSLGFALWQKILSRQLEDLFPTATRMPIIGWLEIVCGHHGQPPKKGISAPQRYLSEGDAQAAEQFIRELAHHWLPDLSPLTTIDKAAFRQVSWQLAGVAVLADWLGSNQHVFHYCAREQPLVRYWHEVALPKAEEVVSQAPFQQKRITPFHSISQQFGFIQQPTPLQNLSQSIELADGPQLFLLEDVTGAGKTEAAMVLTHRLLAADLADGLFVGLPTMATANAMYGRLAKSYRSLYSPDELPSLVLAHGSSQLSKAFTDSVQLSSQRADLSYEREEHSASTYCNQWLADSRKKALLADVGVGTIDQVLLGVLPSRHQSLRLLGLNGKVLLVDEVHAYDPYMRILLAALLRAHASQDGSVILLSATLPHQFRQELVSAFAQGAGVEVPLLNNANDYPLLTQLSAGLQTQGLREIPVPTRPSVQRHVHVERLDSEAQAFEIIQQAVLAGRCVCWVRNTVKDARRAYQQLSASSGINAQQLSLFHSRFAMVDRQVIEADVLARFGKKSTTDKRQGQVLIATQVVEQSLDLDFDLMISDLAPIDLLIQRAGRLQRHTRDSKGNVIAGGVTDERSDPCLYVLSPDPNQIESKNWLRERLPGTQAVYSHVGQLWLTVSMLLKQAGFSMPGDARALIEGVYSEAAQGDIPADLIEASCEAEAEQKAQQGMGAFNRLQLEKGYTYNSAASSGGWDEEVNIPTRLGSDSVAVVLVKAQQGNLVPYADSPHHSWALSQLNIPRHEWDKAVELIPASLHSVIEQLKQDEPALKWLAVLPLVAETQHLYQPRSGWDIERISHL